MWQMLSDEPELGYRVGGVVGKQAQVAPWQGIPHRSDAGRPSAARRRGRRRRRDPRRQRSDVGREHRRGTGQPGLRAACPVLARAGRSAQQPDPHRSGVRSAHALRRGAPAAGMAQSGEASHRHRDRRRPASAVRAGTAGGRDRHPPRRRWPGPLPASRDRPVRGSDQRAQAPHDGAGRRQAARRPRGDEREEGRSPLQGVQRPAGDSDRPHPAGDEHRRAPSALGCPDRPDEPGRTAIRHAQGSRPVRRGAAAADRHATRDNRLVANRSPGQPVLQRVPAVGPALRRQLVPRSGPGHPREHGARRDRPGGEGPASTRRSPQGRSLGAATPSLVETPGADPC